MIRYFGDVAVVSDDVLETVIHRGRQGNDRFASHATLSR